MNERALTLSELIRREQDKTGASYMDIAKKTGLSKAKIGQLANPDSHFRVRQETLAKLANGLRLPLHVVTRAALASDGYDDAETIRNDRVALLLEQLQGLSEDSLKAVEALVNALEQTDAQRG